MPSRSRVLTDHDEIRQWAEERGAKPACVRGTGGAQDTGMIRLDFPGYSGAESLEHISWDDWLEKFDEKSLALLVQDQTARGQQSNFNKLVSRDNAAAGGGSRRRARATSRSSQASGTRKRTASRPRSRSTGSRRTAAKRSKSSSSRRTRTRSAGTQSRSTASRTRNTRSRTSSRSSTARTRSTPRKRATSRTTSRSRAGSRAVTSRSRSANTSRRTATKRSNSRARSTSPRSRSTRARSRTAATRGTSQARSRRSTTPSRSINARTRGRNRSSNSSRSTTTRRASSGRGTRSNVRAMPQRGRSRAAATVTTDHDEIRRWAEERGAKPACVRRTGGKGDIGVIRLDFPGYSGAQSLEPISWDEWFEKFDESGLALLHQETTARGQKSNFNKLVARETANARARGNNKASRRSVRRAA